MSVDILVRSVPPSAACAAGATLITKARLLVPRGSRLFRDSFLLEQLAPVRWRAFVDSSLRRPCQAALLSFRFSRQTHHAYVPPIFRALHRGRAFIPYVSRMVYMRAARALLVVGGSLQQVGDHS